MPAKISLRDARVERMRGCLDEQLIAPKPKQEAVAPAAEKQIEIPPAVVTVDTGPIAIAMDQQARMLSEALNAMVANSETPAQEPVRKWLFKITGRDLKGNITEFTAEANHG